MMLESSGERGPRAEENFCNLGAKMNLESKRQVRGFHERNTKNIKENRSSYNLFKTCFLGSDVLKIISSIVQNPHNVCHIHNCELVVL